MVCSTSAEWFACDLSNAPSNSDEFFAWRDGSNICVELRDVNGNATRNERLALSAISVGPTFQVNENDAKAFLVLGTDGVDRVSLHHPTTNVQLSADADYLYAFVTGYGDNDVIDGSAYSNHYYHENLVGGVGADTISGNNGDDEISGGDGADILHGGPGDDNITGGYGDDTLRGGEGKDIIRGMFDANTIFGGAGDDEIFGGDGDDTIDGGDGDDTIFGDWGDDTIRGGADDDTIDGHYGDDIIFGQDGNDFIEGKWGSDKLAGGAGEDTLRGDDHNDILCGEDDYSLTTNNKLLGGSGEDCLDAGIGNATSDFTREQDCGAGSTDWWVDRGVGQVNCEYDLSSPSATETVSFCEDPETNW